MKKPSVLSAVVLSIVLCGHPVALHAADSWLLDRSGDGIVTFLGFGDSLTYGVGDGTQPGEEVVVAPHTDGTMGYIPRLARLLGIAAVNSGEPGEELLGKGYQRFAVVIPRSTADIVGIFEGENDASTGADPVIFSDYAQRLVNVALASGRTPLLFTLPPPCCNRSGPQFYTTQYSQLMRTLAVANELPLADIERGWRTTCTTLDRCQLFNLPEGLHPNSLGYDVIAQVTAAALLGVDIFVDGGAAELESALGLPPGTVVVKPDMMEAP